MARKTPKTLTIYSYLNQIWRFLLYSFFAQASENIASADESKDRSEELFVRRIFPMISEKCLSCHGNTPDDIQGGLNLRSFEGLQRGGDSQVSLIQRGKPDESPLYLATARNHADWSPMPPKESERLNSEQLDWLKTWIEMGAPWPTQARIDEITQANSDTWAEQDGDQVKTSGGQSSEWTNRRYKRESLWAYQPIRKPVVSVERSWNGNKSVDQHEKKLSFSHAIDRLIERRIPDGLATAPAADAKTLIRRAAFDLTGLPPTPEAIQSFERDFMTSPDSAYSELIDRLLSSPHYGERMAQHWLDVVRYADSSGFANDYERGNAWRYRDYVVRSFNQDKPFQDFILEQIAGDEMDPNDPEKIVATGLLRMGPWELTGMEVAKVARQRFLDDVTNSVGETFLAHSLQCARCHDHKFDPVPTRDYYSIQSVFATTQLAEVAAEFLPSENLDGFEELRYLEKTIADHQQTLNELDEVLLQNAQNWFTENGKDPTAWNAALSSIRGNPTSENGGVVRDKKPNPKLTVADSFSATRNLLAKQGIAESEYPPKLVGFTPEQFGRERVARKGLERIRWEMERYEPFALAVYSGRTPSVTAVYSPTRVPKNRMSQGECEETAILAGGDPFSPLDKVRPGVLSILGHIEHQPIVDSIEGRRLGFARWVAHPDNPLTIRTIVNRVWMWHFGIPLAGNPNNFGSTGKQPTHPELLDWLAAHFVEQGWSIKSLHRSIMLSQAYRRSSIHPDPANLKDKDPLLTSYAVFHPRRLSAEELRDAMLSATGELNPAVGGIPNRPEINLEAALQPRQVMGTFAAAWVPNPKPSQRHRRSLYALKLRGLIDPSMEVFNAPSPDFSCEKRDASSVTPQVFAMFNSQSSYDRALALASRVLRETNSDTDAIKRCFWLSLGRPPKPEELTSCFEHWQKMIQVQSRLKFESIKPPRQVQRDAIEENTGERFSFTETLYANEDFVPDLQAADCDAKTRALGDVCLVLFNTSEFAYVN